MENCIFCRIVKGELPSYKIWENEDFLAFLTIKPIKPGHTLVIPKKHTDYFYDLPEEDLAKLVVSSKPVAEALKKAFEPKTGRIGVMIAGMAVPHVHLHLIPLDSEGELTFDRAKDATDQELTQTKEKILKNLS